MDIKILSIFGLIIFLIGILFFGSSFINNKNEIILSLNNSLNQKDIEINNINLFLDETNKSLNEVNSILNVFKNDCESTMCSSITPWIAIDFLKNHNIGSDEKMYKVADSTKSLRYIYLNKNDYNLDFINLVEKNCPKEYYLTGILSEESKEFMKNHCKTEDINSCDERVKATIEGELNRSKYSSSKHYFTIYNPDITRNDFKERAIVFFDNRANIICAFKFEKEDYFSDDEKVSVIN